NDPVCGNTIMGNNRPTAGICNMACTGDSSQQCGGPDAINIYVKDNYQYTTGPASVLDIYNDSAGWRLLKHQPTTPIPGDEMTVQKCVDACQASGFTSAGVEYGRECYCDNVTYPPGQSQDMGECFMPCTGGHTAASSKSSTQILMHLSVLSPSTPSVVVA
ncbi:7373_t:CDS:2, partial [Acaulospora colombiana]